MSSFQNLLINFDDIHLEKETNKISMLRHVDSQFIVYVAYPHAPLKWVWRIAGGASYFQHNQEDKFSSWQQARDNVIEKLTKMKPELNISSKMVIPTSSQYKITTYRPSYTRLVRIHSSNPEWQLQSNGSLKSKTILASGSTKKETLLSAYQFVSDNLYELYVKNKSLYHLEKNKTEPPSEKLWWMIFVKPNIDLADVFED